MKFRRILSLILAVAMLSSAGLSALATEIVDPDNAVENTDGVPVDEPDSDDSADEGQSAEPNLTEPVEDSINYDPQPASVEDVQAAIDAWEAGGDKPRWESQVDADLIPEGYNCQYVDGYWTIFAGVSATALTRDADGYLLINDADDLDQVRNGLSDKYRLNADIQLTGAWEPIGHAGSTTNRFSGELVNPDGYTITGLRVSGYAYAGLFGYLYNAKIDGLIIESSSVSASGNYSGAVAGYARYSEISNCTVTDITIPNANSYGAGIVGAAYASTISGCDVKNITITGGTSYLGGIAGVLYGSSSDGGSTIDDCTVENITIGNHTSYSGGIAGAIHMRSSVSNVSVKNIKSENRGSYSAGIIGTMYENSSLTNGSVVGVDIYCGTSYPGGAVGEINSSYVKNVSVEDVTISTNTSYPGGFVGTVYNGSSIEDCTVTNADIRNRTTYNYVGGFAGEIKDSTVKNSHLYGATVYGGGEYVGGFTSVIYNSTYGQSVIEGCSVTDATVTGNVDCVGGFAANIYNKSSVSNCFAENVDVSARTLYAGGFASKIYNTATVTNSYSTGTASANGIVGGFSALIYNSAQVTNCYAQTDVSVTRASASAGGFAGKIYDSAKVTNGYATGSVSSNYTGTATVYYMGSFAGMVYNSVELNRVYATGTVLPNTTKVSSVGAFIGTIYNTAKVVNGFYDTTTTKYASPFGNRGSSTSINLTGISTSDMIEIGTFSAWSIQNNTAGAANGTGDAGSPWYIDDEITYPYLYYQYDGHSDADVNYYLGSVTYSDQTSLGQSRADFNIDGPTPFLVTSAGAAKAYFPYTGVSRYVVNSSTATNVPASALTSTSNPYSLGGVSATNIISFSLGPSKVVTGETGRGGATVYPGDELTYTITYVNLSQTEVSNVTITDVLPAGLEYISSTDEDGKAVDNYDPATRTVTWRILNVPHEPEPENSGSVTLTVRVTGEASNPVVNTATMKWDYGDTHEVKATNPLGQKAILEADKTSNREEITRVGEQVTYEILVKNTGTDTAYDVVVRDTLAAGVELVENSVRIGSTTGAYEVEGGVLIIPVGNITAGAELTVSFTVEVTSDAMGKSIRNAGKVTGYSTSGHGNTPDLEAVFDDGNNTVVRNNKQSSKYVASGAGLNGAPVTIGDEITYEIQYVNNTGETRDLVIKDYLHGAVDYLGSTDETGAAQPDSAYDSTSHLVTWTITGVEDGAEGVVTVTVRVTERIKDIAPNADDELVLVNSAELDWGDGKEPEEPEVPNPVGSYKVVAGDSKGADGAMVFVGDEITYEIHYINNTGETSAVNIIDKLHPAVEYINSTDEEETSLNGANYDPATHTVSWRIEDIPANGRGVVTVTVRVTEAARDIQEDADGNKYLVNSAELDWDEGDEPEEPSIPNPIGDESRKYVLTEDGEEVKPVTVGDEITYVIHYSNNTGEKRDLTITDTLPATMAYIGHTENSVHQMTSEYLAGVRQVVWEIKDVEPGEFGDVTVTVRVTEAIKDLQPDDDDGIIYLVNSAELDWGDGEPEIPVIPTPVGSYKVVGEDEGADGEMVFVGDEITYEIHYINNTGETSGVSIIDVLDPAVEYISSSDSGDYDPAARTVSWRIEDIAPHATGYVTVAVRVTEAARDIQEDADGNRYLYNTATLDWDEGDEPEEPTIPTPIGDESRKTIVTENGEEVKAVTIGDVVTYEIYYVNNLDVRQDLEIVDDLHAAVKYIGHTEDTTHQMTSGYDGDIHQVKWEIEGIEPGEGGKVTVTVEVTEAIKDIAPADDDVIYLVNSATLDWSEDDEPEIPVVPTPVGSYKIVADGSHGQDGGRVTIGEQITYEIVYVNNTGERNGVTIKDYLPYGVEYVSSYRQASDVSVNADGITVVTWEIEEMEPGARGSVQVTVLITEAVRDIEPDDDIIYLVNRAELDWGDGNEPEEPSIPNPIGAYKIVSDESQAGQDGEPLTAGDQITYEIYFVNTEDMVRDLLIVDELPEYFKYINSTDIGGTELDGSNYDADTHTVTWAFEGLAYGEGGTVTVTVEVTDAIQDITVGDDYFEIVNSAKLYWDEDTEPEIPVVPNPVGSYKVVANDSLTGHNGSPVTVGDVITYEIAYINNTGEYADVLIKDTLPEYLEYVSSTNRNGQTTYNYDEGNRTVTWSYSNIAPDTKGVVTLTVKVLDTEEREVVNTADITWTNTANGGELDSEDPTAVNPIGSIKRVSEDSEHGYAGTPVYVGKTVTYEIAFVNNFGETAETLTIVDNLPEGLAYVSHTDITEYNGTSEYIIDADTGAESVIWTFTDLPDGATGTVSITVKVTEQAENVVVNAATLTWEFEDGDPETEEPEIPNPVGSRKVVAEDSDKGQEGAVVYVGDEIKYEIQYVNPFDEAADLYITDTLDPGVEYVASDYGNWDGNTRTVSWDVGSVPAGESGSVYVIVRVTLDADATITNEAELTWSVVGEPPETENPEATNPVGSRKTVAEDSAAGVGGSAVTVGDEITYEIHWVNNSNRTADELIIVDTLPEGVEVTDLGGGADGFDADGNAIVTWTLTGPIAPGDSGSVFLTVKVTDRVGSTIRNEAYLTWVFEDAEAGEEPWTENPIIDIPVIRGSDKVVASGSVGYDGGVVHVGDIITYEIAYINPLGYNAFLTIVDVLPEYLDYVYTQYGTYSINDDGRETITWGRTQIASGERGSYTVYARVNELALEQQDSLVINPANFIWTQYNGDEIGTEEKEAVNPLGASKMIYDEAGNSLYGKVVNPNDVVTYRIGYVNGYETARDLVITDVLDEGLAFISCTDENRSDAGGNYDPDTHTVTWAIASVPAGEEGYVEVTLRITENIGNYVVNSASLKWTDGDGNEEEENPNTNNPVGSRKRVASNSAGAGGSRVYVGDEITYEIEYVNTESTARNVVIEDTLDPGVELVWFTGSGNYDEGTHTITWDSITVGANGRGTVRVRVQVMAEAGDIIENSAELRWTDVDNPGGEPDKENPGTENPVGSRKVVASIQPNNGEKQTEDLEGATVHVGDVIRYEIRYINQTGEDALLTITDYLPLGTAYVDSSEGGQHYPGMRTVTWTEIEVAANGRGTVWVEVEVTSGVDTEVYNKADLDWYADEDDNGGAPIDEETPETSNPVGSRKQLYSSSAGYDGTPIMVGDRIVYEILYTNLTNEPRHVTIVDTLPEGLVLRAITDGSVGSKTDKTTAKVGDVYVATWEIDMVPANTTGRVLVYADVESLSGTEIYNEAELFWYDLDDEGREEEPEEENPNITTPVGSRKTLASIERQDGTMVTEDLDGAVVYVGDKLTYRIEFINHTGGEAELVIVDRLADGLRYIDSGDASVGTTDERYTDDDQRVVTWEISEIPEDAVGYVTVTAEVTEEIGDTVTNSAELTWNDGDGGTEKPGTENPVGTRKYVKSGSAGENGAPVEPGDYVTYVISYYNGSGDYAHVTIKDVLAPGLVYVHSSEPGRYSNGEVTWYIEDVAPGTRGEVTVTVQVTGECESTIVNTANVTWESVGEGPDPGPEEPGTENPLASFKHVPEGNGANGDAVNPGDEITYEIVYINQTGEDATLTIVDTLPEDVTFQSAEPDDSGVFSREQVNGREVLTWTLDVAADERGSVEVTVTVNDDPQAEVIRNEAALTWETEGGEPSTEEPGTENPIEKYRVLYHPNSDNADDQPYAVFEELGKEHTVLGNDAIGFTWDDHQFLGWSYNPNATEADLAPGGQVIGTGTVNLYAVWDYTYFTVTYYANYAAEVQNDDNYNDYEQEIEYWVPVADGHTVKADLFYYPGYILLGWSYDEDAKAPDSDLTPGEDVIYGQEGDKISIYGVWAEDPDYVYTVRYYANNGETPEDQDAVTEYARRDHVALSNETTGFSYTGHDFVGWSYERDTQPGDPDIILPGGTVERVGAHQTIELYAVWESAEADTYTVVYHSNYGADETKAYEEVVGTLHTVPNTGITRSGYTLTGWATEPDGEVLYTTGDKVDGTEILVKNEVFDLYALWRENGGGPGPGPVDPDEYTVTFYNNDDRIDEEIYLTVPNVQENTRVTRPAAPEDYELGLDEDGNRVYLEFIDWFTEPECDNVYDFSTPVTGNLSLYAEWEREVVPQEVPPEIDLKNHFAYMVGYEEADGTFKVKPQDYITRGETATLFFRLITDESRETYWSKTNNFSDVASADWYNNAISTAYRAGLVTGHSPTEFAPENNITRAEFAALAARFTGVDSYTGPSVFSDVPESEWFWEEVHIAYQAGWIQGDANSDQFRPYDPITRAEVATLVNRMRGSVPEDMDDLLDDMIVWPDNPAPGEPGHDWYYYDIQEATNSHYSELKLDENGDKTGYETWTELRENRNWTVLQREDATPEMLYAGETWNPRSPDYIPPEDDGDDGDGDDDDED